MNFTTENVPMETTTKQVPISAILNEMDGMLSECLGALNKLNTCVSGVGRLEEKPSDPKCMRECVMLTADKARMVRDGIMQVMEAIGV